MLNFNSPPTQSTSQTLPQQPKSLFVSIKDIAKEIPGQLKKIVAGRGALNLFEDINKPAPATFGSALKEGLTKKVDVAESAMNFGPGAMASVGKKAVKIVAPSAFKGFEDLSTSILEDLKGKTSVSKQYIFDSLNRPNIKQEEKLIVQSVLNQNQGTRVLVDDFAHQVKNELLPLKQEILPSNYMHENNPKGTNFNAVAQYEDINLPKEQRVAVDNYYERIYKSPIKTSAGDVHFGNLVDPETGDSAPIKNYFGHTRVEDMADGRTRRVIEVQSDLYQKNRFDDEFNQWSVLEGGESVSSIGTSELNSRIKKRSQEASKLKQYTNPTAHFRIVREEIKQAAKDGKSVLQFPTGETAMQIEGLFFNDTHAGYFPSWRVETVDGLDDLRHFRNSIKEGSTIIDKSDKEWKIVSVLGVGKFKAIPEEVYEKFNKTIEKNSPEYYGMIGLGVKTPKEYLNKLSETFDISGDVDVSNPIYKFYQKDIGKFLQNKYGAIEVTDLQGVKWWQISIDKAEAKKPILAHGKTTPKVTLIGAGVALGTAAVAGSNPSTINYKREEPIVEEPKVKVVEQIPSVYGKMYRLNTGTEVRDVHEKLKDPIEKTYQNNPDLPKGLLEALLMKESSMGRDNKQRNTDIGEYAWLGGFTKIAKQDLIQNGIVPDLNTREGALDAMAKFWLLRADPEMSVAENYDQIYSSGLLKEESLKQFKDMFEYYKQNYASRS